MRSSTAKALFIDRRKVAARMILKTLLNVSKGAWHIAGDIVSKRRMGMLACEDSRVPDFLLADADFPEGPEQRSKMRPDILLIGPIKVGRSGQHLLPPGCNLPRKVAIVEVGYCSDTRLVDKLTDKHEQHAQLRTLLLANSHTVSVLPIMLGNTGSVYKANANVLRALEVNHVTREHLLKALSIHAVTSLHKISLEHDDDLSISAYSNYADRTLCRGAGYLHASPEGEVGAALSVSPVIVTPEGVLFLS